METNSEFNARQARLALNNDWEVREAVAYNDRTEAKVVGDLLRDDDQRVRRAAASHQDLPYEAVLSVAKTSKDVDVLRSLATRNFVSRLEVSEALVKSDDEETLVNLAENERTPAEILEVLMGKEDLPIRKALAERQ